MWEVIAEIWGILLVSAIIGMAIGYILSSILSTSKIEMLEEENWQLKEDLRKYRKSVSLLETEVNEIKSSESNSGNELSSRTIKSYASEIEKLKAEISLLKSDVGTSSIEQRFRDLEERHQSLLSEREKLLVQIGNLDA